MIRQMGISPGIMNFYTFGTLNHPKVLFISDLVGAASGHGGYCEQG